MISMLASIHWKINVQHDTRSALTVRTGNNPFKFLGHVGELHLCVQHNLVVEESVSWPIHFDVERGTVDKFRHNRLLSTELFRIARSTPTHVMMFHVPSLC